MSSEPFGQLQTICYLGAAGILPLSGAQRRHFGTHQRAIDGVIAQQRHALIIAGRFQPGIEETRRQPGKLTV